MPLSSGQLTQLKSDAQTISNLVSTLVADTVDPATLQAELDAANATIAKQKDQISRMLAQVDAADAADTTEDAARASIRSIAAE
jgi:hypothetical protein